MIILCCSGVIPTAGEGTGSMVTSTGTPVSGYRAYTDWQSQFVAGLPRKQIVKVYAYAGETVYFGSSVWNSCMDVAGNTYGANPTGNDIVVYTPSGSLNGPNANHTWDVTQNGAGYIANPTQEKNGPKAAYTPMISVSEQDDTNDPNTTPANGYTPLSFVAGESGVYEFHFHSYNNVESGHVPTATKLSNESTAFGNQGYCSVAAWDVTVVKTNPDSSRVEAPGRTFANSLDLFVGGNQSGQSVINSSVYVLTDDGYIYKTNFNGLDPNGFIFFANNRGLVSTATNTSLYQSAQDSANSNSLATLEADGVTFQNPNLPNTELDKTYKIFYEQPADDLPASILPKTVYAPSPAKDIHFEGYKNAHGYVGQGGYFVFNITNATSATVKINLSSYKNASGVTVNGGIVSISNAVVQGENRFFWNGKDANGNVVPVGTYGNDPNSTVTATIETKSGEYHFPMLDAESNMNGIIIQLLNNKIYDSEGALTAVNEADRSTVYYNNAQVKKGASTKTGNDIAGLTNAESAATLLAARTTGVSSLTGACKFVSTGTATGGDAAAVDVWTYFKQPDASLIEQVPRFELEDPSSKGNINGFVFYDKDFGVANATSGTFSLKAGDFALSGLTVNLRSSTTGDVVATTTTDAYGNYSFLGAAYGTYTVDVIKPNSAYTLATTTEIYATGDNAGNLVARQMSVILGATSIDLKDVGFSYTPYAKSISVAKVWAVDNTIDTAQPTSVDVDIVANYTNGTEKTAVVDTVTLSAANNWHTTVSNLPNLYDSYTVTSYTVEEEQTNNYYVSTDTSTTASDILYTLTNTPNNMLYLIKKDAAGEPVAGATFNLYQTYNGSAVATTGSDNLIQADLTTDANGRITVHLDHAIGYYYFEETAAPTGYLLSEDPRTALKRVVHDSAQGYAIFEAQNEKAVHFTITQAITAASDADQTFLYEIKGPDDFTAYASLTVSAGATGASQDVVDLPPGTYTVRDMDSNWTYQIVEAATNATDGTATYSYNAGGLEMAVTDQTGDAYAYHFTSALQDINWRNDSDHVTNEMGTQQLLY
ncbi:MAG: SpaA isopeptide-forming pilin-related protein [Oscillospiraceae bacterium]